MILLRSSAIITQKLPKLGEGWIYVSKPKINIKSASTVNSSKKALPMIFV